MLSTSEPSKLGSTTALSILLGLSLTACVHTGHYPIADLNVPTHYGQTHREPTELISPLELTHPAQAPAADPWWQAFGDPVLDRLVDQVLAVNSDLASAGLRPRRARLNAGLAGNQLLPQFDGSLSAAASQSLDEGDSGRSSSARLGVSYAVDLWGRLRDLRDIAGWEVRATAADRETTALLLISDTCNLYWTLAFLNQRLGAGELSLQRVERSLQIVQTQFRVGAISRLELSEAEQNLQSQTASQSQLRQQRVETRNALSILLDGQPWPDSDEPQDLSAAHSPPVQPGLPSELLARRPDLRAIELRLRQALTGIEVDRKSYYPALNLTGGVGTGGNSLADVISNPVATLGAGLSLPFLRWREMQLNVDLAGTDYQIAASEFRKTLYTALSEVDNALSARTELAIQIQSRELAYAAAQRAEAAYEVRYRVGAASLRLWLDAQESRRNAEIALAQARLDQLRNDVGLVQALGGGWGDDLPSAVN